MTCMSVSILVDNRVEGIESFTTLTGNTEVAVSS